MMDGRIPERSSPVDVVANRRTVKWTWREQVGRILWDLVHPLFVLSPRPLWGWRNTLLRLFGARIGRRVRIHPTVRITIPKNLTIGNDVGIGDRAILYALGPISIGARTTISQGTHLCAGTHQWRDPTMPLQKPPIRIGRDAWICADAFVGPGVTIGECAIVGARAVTMSDVQEYSIVAGNPAREIGKRA